jgi:hypothetical protein
MPGPEQRSLTQRAVWWAFDRTDRYGDPVYVPGEEIPVRWEDRKSQAIDSQGNKINVDATVGTNKLLAVNDLLWLGKLKDMPAQPTLVREVVSVEVIPDIKGRFNQYTILCRNYAGRIQIPGTGT